MGANAVTTVPVYVAGEVLTAADLNITNSGIPVFADSTARDAGFGGTGEKILAEGQFAYLESTNATQFYDGAAWNNLGGGSSETWTPSYVGITIGNGTVISRYTQINKFVFVQYQLTFGSTTSITSGTNSITLPVTAATISAFTYAGVATLTDSGTGIFFGRPNFNATTTFTIERMVVSGANVTTNSVTSTTPFTWTTNDIYSTVFSYIAA